MRFFSRRGRSRSVDRAAKAKRDRQQEQQSYRTDKRSQTCDDSIGSELPTLDQFEIAVPSKSFQSANSMGDHNEYDEAREDDAVDNRSTTDISSITSVSYRAGYYYLRNVKKKTPEKKKQSGCLPNCSCALCMPCSCSWLTCCCCHEAKSELAAVNKPHPMLAHREKARKAQSPRRIVPPGHGPLGYPHHPSSTRHGRMSSSSNRRYTMSGDRSRMDQSSPMGADDSRMYTPSLKRNHSLFDELSEDEEMPGYGGQQRGRHQQQHQQPLYNSQKQKNRQKPWLRARPAGGGAHQQPHGGGYGHHGPPEYSHTPRDKSTRSRSRGRGRR